MHSPRPAEQQRKAASSKANTRNYATRQQTAAYDENKRTVAKAALPPKGPSMATTKAPAPTAQANSRRALGDIGNLVGALSTRCNVSKNGLLQENLAVAVKGALVDRPITRRSVSNLANSQVLPQHAPALVPPTVEEFQAEPKVEDAVSWGAKQRRTVGPSKIREIRREIYGGASLVPTDGNEELSSATALACSVPAAQPICKKALAKCDARAVPVKKRQTLTAILTARSEAAACGGFEVEMEETELPVPSIDSGDVGNQLAVVDYVEDIYDFYRKIEIQSVAPDYMSRQTDINEKMRAILIDWLIEVHFKFKLMPETLFLTTNLIDRFLARHRVLRKYLQLVGVTAMLVASKYEEIWAPEVQDLIFISDNAYTREQLLEMEKNMLNKLKFNLTVPTPYMFLVRFLKAAASDIQMEMLAFFLVELCLPEYTMVKYPPSLLAAAAVYTAQQTLRTVPSWSPLLQRHTGYTEMQLRECAGMMAAFHGKAGKGELVVVYKKYSNSSYHSVATLQPATFPPVDSVSKAG